MKLSVLILKKNPNEDRQIGANWRGGGIKMASILGKVEVERLDHFLVANNIVDGDKKRAFFLSVVGPKPYRKLTSLLSPEKPGEKSYHQLVEFLKKQYNPRPSEIMQRFKFHSE